MILFQPEHIEPILNGTKTQTRRLGKKRWKVGALRQCQTKLFDNDSVFCKVIIEDVYEQKLVDMSFKDVEAEGYSTHVEYMDAFCRINKIKVCEMSYIMNIPIWVVKFRVVTK